jgi:hypothetical protein
MARSHKSSVPVVLSPDEHQTWARWQRSTTMGARLAQLGKILLLLAAGSSQSNVAQPAPLLHQITVPRAWVGARSP